jgi:hypothetical protein
MANARNHPQVSVHRRWATPDEHDDRCRELAARIESEHPGWLVIWGPYSREFWAFAYLHVPSGTLIHASDPETLLTGILETETQASRNH